MPQDNSKWLGEGITWVILLACLLYLPLLGLRGLCEPDEGRYAEISREMIQTHNYLFPTLNYIKHFHKPPLLYWIVAGSMKIFGQNEFGARFPVGLFAIIGVMVCYLFAKKMFPERGKAGVYSSLVLMLSLQYFIWSQVLSSDMVFSVLLYLSFYFLWRYITEGKGLYFMYIFLALSFLVKGPVGVILIFIIYSLYSIFSKRQNRFGNIFKIGPIIVFLLISLPWFIYVVYKTPGLLGYFLRYQLLDRFFTTIHGRERPFYFFLGVLLVGTLPWTWWIGRALWAKRKYIRDERYLFLYLWIFVPLIFFSLSWSKLAGYILPVYLPVSIMAGDLLSGIRLRLWRIVIGCFFIYYTGLVFAWSFEDALGENFSVRKPARIILSGINPEDKVINFRCFIQALPFYLKRRIILVEKKREIQFEKDYPRDYYIMERSRLVNMLRGFKVYGICNEDDFKELMGFSPVSLRILWKNKRYVLFTNKGIQDSG